jgi:hypothetical protein
MVTLSISYGYWHYPETAKKAKKRVRQFGQVDIPPIRLHRAAPDGE